MNSSRISIWLLCAGAVALACGPRAREAATADSTVAAAPEAEEGSALASSLDVAVGSDVRLTLHLTNGTDSTIELRFSSGQTHDFSVLDSAGREVWRWSADRMFTQAMQTRSLTPGQSLTYEERWSPGTMTGQLTAVGRLTSTNMPVERRVEFALP